MLLGGTAIGGLMAFSSSSLADPLPAGCVYSVGLELVLNCPTASYSEPIRTSDNNLTIKIGAGSSFNVDGKTPILMFTNYRSSFEYSTIILGDKDNAPIVIDLQGENVVGAAIDADWRNSPAMTISGHAVVNGSQANQSGLQLNGWGEGTIDVKGAVNLEGEFARALEVVTQVGFVDIDFEGDLTLSGPGGHGVFAARESYDPLTLEWVEADVDVNIDGDLFISAEAANAFSDMPNKQPAYRGSTGIVVDNAFGGANIAFGDLIMEMPESAVAAARVDAKGLLVSASGDVVIDGGDITVEGKNAFAVNVGSGVRQDPYSNFGATSLDVVLGDVSVSGDQSQGIWLRADRIEADLGDITLNTNHGTDLPAFPTALMLSVGDYEVSGYSEVSFETMDVTSNLAFGVFINPLYDDAQLGVLLDFDSITMNPVGELVGQNTTEPPLAVGIAYGLQTQNDLPTPQSLFLLADGDITVNGPGAGVALVGDGSVHFAYLGTMDIQSATEQIGAAVTVAAVEEVYIENIGRILAGDGGAAVYAYSENGDSSVENSGLIDVRNGVAAVQIASTDGHAKLSNFDDARISGSVSMEGVSSLFENDGIWDFVGDNEFSSTGDNEIAGRLINNRLMQLGEPGIARFHNAFADFTFVNNGHVSTVNGQATDEVTFEGVLLAMSKSVFSMDARFDGAASQADLLTFTLGSVPPQSSSFVSPTTVNVAAGFAGVYDPASHFVPLIAGADLNIALFNAASPVIEDGITDWTWVLENGEIGYRSSENAARAASAGGFGMSAVMAVDAFGPAAFGSTGTGASGGGAALGYDAAPLMLGYDAAPGSGPEFPIVEASASASYHGRIHGGSLSDASGGSADMAGLTGGVDWVVRGDDGGNSGYGVFGGLSVASL
jgi:hypothetical protein